MWAGNDSNRSISRLALIIFEWFGPRNDTRTGNNRCEAILRVGTGKVRGENKLVLAGQLPSVIALIRFPW